MYPINEQQLHSLIHEVVSTYVWQFLAKILNYDRQTQKPDFTAQWETLSEALSADIGKNLSHYFTITTAHEAQHRLDDILALVSNELASRTAVSETDRRILSAASKQRESPGFIQMMENRHDSHLGTHREREEQFQLLRHHRWTQDLMAGTPKTSPCRVALFFERGFGRSIGMSTEQMALTGCISHPRATGPSPPRTCRTLRCNRCYTEYGRYKKR